MNKPCDSKDPVDAYADLPDIIKQGMRNAALEEPRPVPPPPPVNYDSMPIAHQVKNFMDTARQVVREAVQGRDVIVSQEKFDSRMTVCRGCEFISPDHSKCQACGCHLGLKLKFQASTCPKGRW